MCSFQQRFGRMKNTGVGLALALWRSPSVNHSFSSALSFFSRFLIFFFLDNVPPTEWLRGELRTLFPSIVSYGYIISSHPVPILRFASLLAAHSSTPRKVAPSALSRAVRPTSPTATLPSLASTALHFLVGSAAGGKADASQALRTALENGESAIAGTRGAAATAAELAPAVALAMRCGAQIVPCAVLGGGGGGGGRFALASAAAAWGLGGSRPGGVVVVCARPVRVPFTAEPTPALVMESAEAVRAAAAQAGSEHRDAFFGCHGN